ncbi:MAG: divergent polysaccharide deacetylase family protein [Candidatus Omnitrophica bacterium]|nr:divergent polysaccharide deacetylase family protein [Candidatus Omnitrophota bacterium]
MKKDNKLITAIVILSAVIVLQWIFIANIGRARKPEIKPSVPAAAIVYPRIAIVLDDWGYNLNSFSILDGIDRPLTMAVLPNLNFSRTAAKELQKRGFEVILHLPMQPRENVRLEKNTILISSSEEEIKSILNKDLAGMPVSGVSNHMGSAATSDLRIMRVVFEELKKRNLYFFDSFVISNSVCPELARKMRVRFAKRDIFLDNINDAQYIKSQIYKLKLKAKFYGSAIGIGHDRKLTLEVLAQVMPELEKEGYKFVFLSDLVK